MKAERRHITAAFKSYNETENSAEFIISDETEDRHGTIIPVESWDLKNYDNNPIVFYQHAGHYSDDPDDTIGRGQVRIEDGKLIGKVFFEPKELNEKADKIRRKVEFGTLRATSVGFVPIEKGEYRTVKNEAGQDLDVYVYGKVDLLEWSIVNIPSNPNAVAKMVESEAPELPTKEEKSTEAITDQPEVEIPEKENDFSNLGLYKKRLSLTRKMYNL